MVGAPAFLRKLSRLKRFFRPFPLVWHGMCSLIKQGLGELRPWRRSAYIDWLDSELWRVKKMTHRGRLGRIVTLARELHQREKQKLREEISRIPGLMALLMKPRNGERWSPEDRALLKAQLRGLGMISFYLAILAIPGTPITLPLLAWWLDRRRCRRISEPDAGNSNKEMTPSR